MRVNMKIFSRIVTLALLAVLFSGCSSNLVKESASNDIKPPKSNMASIVFMRNAFTSNMINEEVFEIIDDKPQMIGALPNGTKFVYRTPPGHKVFMTHGTRVDFMIADVLPGKTYYVITRPTYATGIFIPTPIRKTSGRYNMQMPEFTQWKEATQLMELNKDEAVKWFAGNKEKIVTMYEQTWGRFQQKNPDDLAQCTLNPQDGI